MKYVIARYSWQKALAPTLLCFAVAALIFYFSIWFDGGHVLKFVASPGKRYWLPILAVGWICALVTLLVGITLVWRMLLDGAAAVWIENGKLIFLHPWVLSVNCSDIAHTGYGTTGRVKQEAITLRLRSGRQKAIPTGALCESKEIVLARLIQKINQLE